MPVNRRNAIKRLALISAGAALLPACFHDNAKPAFPTKNFQLKAGQQQQLEELTAAIIPSGTTPGAREVSAHLFVLKMLDDCFSKDDRDKFLRGLQKFDMNSISTLDAQKASDADVQFFYNTTKRLTIHAYTSSQYYLTKVQVYELVPSRWHGCVPVKPQPNSAS